jgi:ATP-dependent protease ClpP protease subunit
MSDIIISKDSKKIDISVFENMSDSDFFTNKLTHIYFNTNVNEKSVDKLINDIKDAHKDKITPDGAIIKPKPILIHISSYGGDVTAGMRLLSIYSISSLPIATIIDNYSSSAATFLSINSHYRLTTDYGFCLIHAYSISGLFKNEKQHELKRMMEIFDSYFAKIIDMYLERTKFEKKELLDILQHDLILDSKYCLKKGIVDRIIKIEKKEKKMEIKTELNINELINYSNTVIISCSSAISKLDKILFEENLAPVVIYARKDACYNDDASNLQNNIYETLNMIPRIVNLKVPTYAIIDNPISIDDLLPMLYCDHIFIFDYSYIVCNILNYYNKSSLLLDDNIKNTKLIFGIIFKILKEKTKMTDVQINNINNKFTLINSSDCIKFGLANSIIDHYNKQKIINHLNH